MSNTGGKVFGHLEGQRNDDNPNVNPAWGKFGGQASSEDKLRAYQLLERDRQRGGSAVTLKTKKIRIRIPRSKK